MDYLKATGLLEQTTDVLLRNFDRAKTEKPEVDPSTVVTVASANDADVLVMGRLCDGVLLSVLRDVSRIPLVYEACERIRSVDIPLIGTVLNGVSFGKYRPYYSSYTIEVSTKSKSKARKK